MDNDAAVADLLAKAAEQAREAKDALDRITGSE